MAGVSTGTVVGGKYRLEEAIGRGGMGSVWRATHTTLDSPVAVKLLETFGSARDHMAKRFLREARLAGALRNRHIVHILDYGVMDDGQPFMVMELLEGQSLGDRLDHGPPLGELELLEVVAAVLSGLAVVHEAGIVHRDVKPDNIFLVRDADGEYPKLLDFGISRGMTADVGDTRVTRTGAVIGTPLYMSPEQARGMSDVDARTDLWSVGMILWEGLTGELPFESEHMGDVLIRVVTEDAPSIATRRPDLPLEVVDVVDGALSRARGGRPESARAMREAIMQAIEALRTGAPSPARSGRAVERTLDRALDRALDRTVAAPPLEKPGRWPLWVGGGALLTLALATSLVLALGIEVRFAPDEERTDAAESPLASPPIGSSRVRSSTSRTSPIEPVGEPTPAEGDAPVAAEAVAAEAVAAEAVAAEAVPNVGAEGEAPPHGLGDPEPPEVSASPLTHRRGARPGAATRERGGSSTPPERDRGSGRFLRDLDY